jgi:hypothetical protein
MKHLTFVIALVCLSLAAHTGFAQDKPGAVVTEVVEGVVTVRSVNYQDRTVILEGEDGQLITIDVPKEAQNLDQVYAGAQFRVRYLQSMAVFISPVSGPLSADAVSSVELAPKGATPGGLVVAVRQIQARVDAIDYDNRTVVLTGPEGNSVKLKVDERVTRLKEVNVGDIVVVGYTQALAAEMIKQQK